MALTKCKECNKEVSDKAATCPHCGVASPGIASQSVATKEAPKKRLRWKRWVFGTLGVLFLIGVLTDPPEKAGEVAGQLPAAETPAPIAQAPAADKHFNFTAGEYAKYFNAVMRNMDDPARLRATVETGAVNDVFKGAINEHAHLLGVVGKEHGKVSSITLIAASDGSPTAGANILIAALGAMAAALPDVDIKLVGPEVSALIMAGAEASDRKAARVFKGARLSFSQSDTMGIWITAEPL